MLIRHPRNPRDPFYPWGLIPADKTDHTDNADSDLVRFSADEQAGLRSDHAERRPGEARGV